MAGEITTLFWDIGGVILSDGWDTSQRRQAALHFQIDLQEIEPRHHEAFPIYEAGKISLDEYLDRAVFFRPRSFGKEEFTAFILGQSGENQAVRAVLDAVTSARRYFLATINNEGAELNAYRIGHFQLTRNFTVFFSSCYFGVRKPDEAIYRMALGVTQRKPAECLMIDDRIENLETARRLGMQTVHFQNAAQLRADLAGLGILGAAA